MTEADLPSYVAVGSAAFAGTSITELMWPNGKSAADIETLISTSRETLQNDPNTDFVKVTETETDTIIACAQWTRIPARTPEELAKPYKMPSWSPGANASVKEFFFAKFFRARDEVMGGKPFWLLSIMATRPEYQGRGAGSMLMKSFLEKVDEDGWECYVEASPRGRGLYEKFGFRVVRALDIELSPWGKQGEWRNNVAMVREAKGKLEM